MATVTIVQQVVRPGLRPQTQPTTWRAVPTATLFVQSGAGMAYVEYGPQTATADNTGVVRLPLPTQDVCRPNTVLWIVESADGAAWQGPITSDMPATVSIDDLTQLWGWSQTALPGGLPAAPDIGVQAPGGLRYADALAPYVLYGLSVTAGTGLQAIVAAGAAYVGDPAHPDRDPKHTLAAPVTIAVPPNLSTAYLDWNPARGTSGFSVSLAPSPTPGSVRLRQLTSTSTTITLGTDQRTTTLAFTVPLTMQAALQVGSSVPWQALPPASDTMPGALAPADYSTLHQFSTTAGRTYTFPAASGQLAALNAAQSWSQPQTMPIYDAGGAVCHIGAYGGSPSASAATNDAAFTAAHAAVGTGGTILYGGGTYQHTTITVSKCIAVVGAGFTFSGQTPATVLKFPAGTPGIVIANTASGASVRDLALIGGSYVNFTLTGPGTDSGIEVHASWTHVQRVTISQFGNHGFLINNLAGENSSHGVAIQVNVVSCGQDAFHVRTAGGSYVNSNNWRFIGCGGNGCGGWGYFQSGGLMNTLINPRFQLNLGLHAWPVVSGLNVTSAAGINQPGLSIAVATGVATVAGTQHTLSAPVILTMPANQSTAIDWDGLGSAPSNFLLTTTPDPDASHVRLAMVTTNGTAVTQITVATTRLRENGNAAASNPGGIWIGNDLAPAGRISSTTVINPYVEGDGHGDVYLKHGGGIYDTGTAPGSAGGNIICPQPQQWRLTWVPTTSGTYLTLETGALALHGSGVAPNLYPTLRLGAGTFATGNAGDFSGTAEIGINLSSAQANAAGHMVLSAQVAGLQKFGVTTGGAVTGASFATTAGGAITGGTIAGTTLVGAGTLSASTITAAVGTALLVTETGTGHIQEWWNGTGLAAQVLNNGAIQAGAGFTSLATALQGTSTPAALTETLTPFAIYSLTTPAQTGDLTITGGTTQQIALAFTTPAGASMPLGSVRLFAQLDAANQPSPLNTMTATLVADNAGQPTGAALKTGLIGLAPLTTTTYTAINIGLAGVTLLPSTVYWIVVSASLATGKILHIEYDQNAGVPASVLTWNGTTWTAAPGLAPAGAMIMHQQAAGRVSLTISGEASGATITARSGSALILSSVAALGLSATSITGTGLQAVSTTGAGLVSQSTYGVGAAIQQDGGAIVAGFGSANPAAWIRRLTTPAAPYTGPMVKIDDTLSGANSTGNALEYWKAGSLVASIADTGAVTALSYAGSGAGLTGLTGANFGNQAAATLLIGPVSGAAAPPTYRALVTTDLPAAVNLAAQYNVRALSYDPATTNGSCPLTSGIPYLVRVWVGDTFTCTTITLYLQTAGSGLTASQNFVSLANAAGTLLFTTAAGAMDATFTATLNQPIATGGIVLTPGFYWVEILANGTTPPVLASVNSNSSAQTNFGLAGGASRAGTLPGAQTAPASFTPQGSITASSRLALVALS